MKGNPAVTAIAAGVGVLIAGLFISKTDVVSAVIGAVVTAAVAYGLLLFLAKRKT